MESNDERELRGQKAIDVVDSSNITGTATSGPLQACLSEELITMTEGLDFNMGQNRRPPVSSFR